MKIHKYSELVKYVKNLVDDDLCGVTLKESIEYEFQEYGEKYHTYINVDDINTMVGQSKVVDVSKTSKRIRIEFENGKILYLNYKPQFTNIPIVFIENQN